MAGNTMEFPNIYKGDYRVLIVPPLLLLLLSLYFLPQLKMGVEFTGGTLVTFVSPEPVEQAGIEEVLMGEGLSGELKVFPTARGYAVEILLPQDEIFATAEQLKEKFAIQQEETERAAYQATIDASQQAYYEAKRAELDKTANALFTMAGEPPEAAAQELPLLRSAFANAYAKVYDNYRERITQPLRQQFSLESLSLQTVSPTLSVHFLSTATNVVLAAAVLSVLLVFVFFRTFIPSLAVLTGAFSDILIALGAMAFFGIPLTLASFAALLMLIGFSLDTDILLTMRMLRRKEHTPRENAYDAMRTGTTMSVAAIVAFGILFMLSTLTRIPTYFEISGVALAGLVGDLFATWGINAVVLLAYMESRERRSVL